MTGVYWGTGKGDNSPVIEKGINSLCPPVDLVFWLGTRTGTRSWINYYFSWEEQCVLLSAASAATAMVWWWVALVFLAITPNILLPVGLPPLLPHIQFSKEWQPSEGVWKDEPDLVSRERDLSTPICNWKVLLWLHIHIIFKKKFHALSTGKFKWCSLVCMLRTTFPPFPPLSSSWPAFPGAANHCRPCAVLSPL